MKFFLHQSPGLVISALGLLAFWKTGNNRRVGWALAMLSEVAWASWAVWIGQYSVLIACVTYGTVYLRNFMKWKPGLDTTG